MLLIGAVIVSLVGLSVLLVIAAGSVIHAQDQLADLQSQAAYYGLPTQPFATLVPDFGHQAGTTIPLNTTPLPGIGESENANGDFPAFVALDDPRWMHVTMAPLGGSFDLRSVPSIDNNDPLQTISQTTTVYIVTDSDWGGWIQVKLGDTVAWVDTSTVEIREAT